VKKYGTTKQVTVRNSIRSTKARFACRVTKARTQTHTHNT